LPHAIAWLRPTGVGAGAISNAASLRQEVGTKVVTGSSG
jgi:hypothetical protein